MATRDELQESAWVVVLNDNDTYTGMDGRWIAMTDQDQVTALHEGESINDVCPVRYDMQKILTFAIEHGYFD
jgi:hypothetical protein